MKNQLLLIFLLLFTLSLTACTDKSNSPINSTVTNLSISSENFEEPTLEIDAEVFESYSQLYAEKSYAEIIETSTKLDASTKSDRVQALITDSISALSLEAQKKATEGKYGAALTLLSSSSGTLLDESYREQWNNYRAEFMSLFKDQFNAGTLLHPNTEKTGVYNFIASKNVDYDDCSVGGTRYCEAHVVAFNKSINFFLYLGHSDTNWFSLQTISLNFNHNTNDYEIIVDPITKRTGSGLGWVYEAATLLDQTGDRLAEYTLEVYHSKDQLLPENAKAFSPQNLCPMMHNFALSNQTNICFRGRSEQSHVLTDEYIQEILNTWALYQLLRENWSTFDEIGFKLFPNSYQEMIPSNS